MEQTESGREDMYKRRRQRWMKHLDFIILDALALQIAFILSYSIYNGEVGLPYLSETYRTIGIFLFLLDAFLAISFDNFHNVLDRGMLVELSQTVKLALMDYAGLATVLFAMKMSGAYSRVMLTATMALYVGHGEAGGAQGGLPHSA